VLWEHYSTVKLPSQQASSVKRRYGVTSHVLSYRRCSRQYGQMVERRYEPALAVQLFYGTIVHQVLDLAHAHYAGRVAPELQGHVPSEDDIERYFTEVENGLRARRVYAVANIREHALKVLKRFNALEGPTLYARVLDTECRLQADRGSYILHGMVDVLARGRESDESGKDGSGMANVELWDYKGTKKPSRASRYFRDHLFQMRVYADLYRLKEGRLPRQGVLYFLNELGDDPAPTARPVNAVMMVTFDEESIREATASFEKTVADIEGCRLRRQWPSPSSAPPGETCDACDLRWDCDAARRFRRNYRMIYP